MGMAGETTKRVRVLVAIDKRGCWTCGGFDFGSGAADPHEWLETGDLNSCRSYHWIEADVPVPVETTIEGKARGQD
jgi:hypothetical protein